MIAGGAEGEVTARLAIAAILVLAAMVFYGKQSVTVAGGQVVMFNRETFQCSTLLRRVSLSTP